jgi:YHS domain-containing protein
VDCISHDRRCRPLAFDGVGRRLSHCASAEVDTKLVLNLLGLLVFGALFALTLRRGATDPVCGMTVDRAKARTSVRDGVTYYFCGEGCRQTFESGAAVHGH